MTGVSSYHSNDHEDRRWKFQCCKADDYSTTKCSKTGYVNNWDGQMSYRTDSEKDFITGTTSVHDNGRE